jgi:hypothetical protein
MDVVAHLRTGQLQKIAEEYTYDQRTAIRSQIDDWNRITGSDHPAKKWLDSPAGSSF